MQNTEKKQLSALDEYINKVYVLILILVPGACQCAGLLYTAEKMLGLFPTVSWVALIVFDVTCLIYLVFGIYFVRTGFLDGIVSEKKLKASKIFLVVIMFTQYNFILYMIPSTEFWGYALLFVIATAFFLDVRMVLVTSIEITVSLAVSWFVIGERLLPVRDNLFIPNLIGRIVCIVLTLFFIIILTYLVRHFLVTAKKDELERNTEKVTNVLLSVQKVSENLFGAGTSLFQVSESESASVEELSATSTQLLDSSNLLDNRTNESLSNLNELNNWEAVLSENVEKVQMTSKELLQKSEENEQLLNELRTINSDVSESMQMTVEVAQSLSQAVGEIGTTLNFVSEISSSTNLLALNASIEAARAGEAGKGFAVVAQQVGQLANNTKESLDGIEEIITKVQNNVNKITVYIEENSQKLDKQNESFHHVFSSMQDMTGLLNMSVDVVNTMGEAHDKQADVIKNTVRINKDIAESIQSENQQFASINEMVESNVRDITEMTKQINLINEMVDEMKNLLNN